MTAFSHLPDIRARIAAAANACGRDPASVSLTAVSKQQDWDKVAAVIADGQMVFGENRVQDAQERWEGRRGGLELRLIGPLQSNKAAEAVTFFNVIETVDREKIARALADAIQRQGKTPKFFIQVNTGEEPQKAGISPREADVFVALCRDLDLPVEGLMCIPPHDAPAGPHFAMLAEIAARNGLARLSMGMSDDFDLAIRFGATDIRVGSALFGARQPKA